MTWVEGPLARIDSSSKLIRIGAGKRQPSSARSVLLQALRPLYARPAPRLAPRLATPRPAPPALRRSAPPLVRDPPCASPHALRQPCASAGPRTALASRTSCCTVSSFYRACLVHVLAWSRPCSLKCVSLCVRFCSVLFCSVLFCSALLLQG